MESISSSSPTASAKTAKASGATAERHPHGHVHLQAKYNQGIRMQNSTNPNGTRIDTRDDTFARNIGDPMGRKRFISENLAARCSSPHQERSHPAQYLVPGVKPTHHLTHSWHHRHSSSWYPRGGYRPISQSQPFTIAYNGLHRGSSAFNRPNVSIMNTPPNSFRTVDSSGRRFAMAGPSQWIPRSAHQERNEAPLRSVPHERDRSAPSLHKSHIVIPENVILPKEISPLSETNRSPVNSSLDQRLSNRSDSSPPLKRSKNGEALNSGFGKLDLLCAATLDLGPLQENPSGCSCPKSKCIALYCDCFKAGRRCNPDTCSCHNCKNTVEESGAEGARSKAIQAILARNPRAFTNNANKNGPAKLPPGEQGCNCIRSRCLKLYCTCFQRGKFCDPSICTCVSCLNTKEDVSGMRQMAVESTLEKRPDAFKQKSGTKILGAGCACKNNQCVRKYCECFRTNLKCSKKCSCKECKNR